VPDGLRWPCTSFNENLRRQRASALRLIVGAAEKHPLARFGLGLITGVADDDPTGISGFRFNQKPNALQRQFCL
jgi:hypothetical protein